MKFFIDTASVEEIRKANDMGIICGVTTNPSLIAKEGRDFNEVIKEITEIVDGPISGEVKATTADAEGMIREAKKGDYPSNLTFEVADATALPYKDDSFDVVLIANALHVMPEPEKALSEIDRVLKPGGILMYSTCTLVRAENEGVVESFLQENKDYYLEPLPLPAVFPKNESGMLALVPGEYDTDGFFIARMRRKACTNT